jgi:CDP-4-dehydro-6-deoxyglucose reductase
MSVSTLVVVCIDKPAQRNDVGEELSLPSEFERYRNIPSRYPIDARLDPSQLEVYTCGLNAMVSSLVEAAERLGAPPEHTQLEGFG